LITWIIFGDQYRSLRSSLCSLNALSSLVKLYSTQSACRVLVVQICTVACHRDKDSISHLFFSEISSFHYISQSYSLPSN
jgi:hypothetical protein